MKIYGITLTRGNYKTSGRQNNILTWISRRAWVCLSEESFFELLLFLLLIFSQLTSYFCLWRVEGFLNHKQRKVTSKNESLCRNVPICNNCFRADTKRIKYLIECTTKTVYDSFKCIFCTKPTSRHI